MKKSLQIKPPEVVRGLHVIAKPIGPICNLNCDYCFYREKKEFDKSCENYRMSDEVLAVFIEKYITSQAASVVEFVWQGGEPTLLGRNFFERVVELQRSFSSTKTIVNSIQTNGTLLDDKWCLFLKQHDFMVGISLDGPREIHDCYRGDLSGEGSFDRTIRGLRLLQKHGVEYNVIACVTRESTKKPLEVYRFFKSEGVEFIQFVPIIERLPSSDEQQLGQRLAGPSNLEQSEANADITPWSVVSEEYGDFLIAIYEDWIRHDVGKTFVMNFEWALNAWIGNPSAVCIHAKQCGRALVIEHNGDVFACDHYVYPDYRLGNILSDNFYTMVETSHRSGFGVEKESLLPSFCLECEVLTACQGGCPKHRFENSHYNEPGLNYLCPGYRKFFLHIRDYQRAMTTLMMNGLPVSDVMKAID